jgi:acyl-CoA synthetase (AMP-forming)/AMP-acid ligase II
MWNFNKFADNTAFIDEIERRYSYSFLQNEGEKLAARIGGRKLVFCLCSNTIGSALGYTAFLNNRIVPLMLDAGLNNDSLSALIEKYKPDYIWKPDESAEFGYALEKTPFDNAFPMHDDLALLLTTSGSTGSPRFVRQSYANIRSNTESIAEYLRLDASERPITTLPMSYTYGLSIINSHLYVGASIILTQKSFMQKEFWERFRNCKATSFGGAPYSYEILDKLRFYKMNLPSLRVMTQAGGKLPPELHRKFAEFASETGGKFIIMYGQTEATARMSYLPPEKSLEKPGSMGIAIPGGEFSLIDVDGNVIDQSGATGELVYKGPNVALGYAESGADLKKGDENGGVLITGDMAKRDEDGYYYIVGRKKRFLKIFGARVNLDETESLIKAAFSAGDFACGGVDDKLKIFITEVSQKESVIKFLAEKTGFNRAAFEVAVVAKIPRSESGKILYGELSKQ